MESNNHLESAENAQKNIQQQIAAAKAAIDQANCLIDDMNTLKKKLHLKEGCGQRYLQKAKPSMEILKQVEDMINAEYSGNSDNSIKTSIKEKGQSKMLNNIAHKNRI